ncbi:cytochrome c biogenesis protein [Myxococcota bacterium]|nr:cytochrome c biogenesis protein [Myxococcota bacterium]MCZ7620031.1 cytochrome c biogenesis protein [Myxococcota bacterium]
MTAPGPGPSGIERLTARLRGPTGWLLLVILVPWLAAVAWAPEDSVQGVVQKILYVHPPLAFAAYLGFLLTALAGGVFLWRGDEAWDRLARSSAEVGVLFCTLVVVTGPIWARGTWGRWWSWDPRLTVTLLLWFVYLAYLLLRGFTEGSERAARFAAVYGIIGIAVIPLNYFAIELAGGRAIHPENLARGSLGAGMGLPFLLGTLASLGAFVHLVVRRVELEGLRNRLAERAGADGGRGEEFGSWDT